MINILDTLQTVTHPSTNRTRRRVTSLIETNANQATSAASLKGSPVEDSRDRDIYIYIYTVNQKKTWQYIFDYNFG